MYSFILYLTVVQNAQIYIFQYFLGANTVNTMADHTGMCFVHPKMGRIKYGAQIRIFRESLLLLSIEQWQKSHLHCISV